MQRSEGVGAEREPLLGEQGGRQRVALGAGECDCGGDDAAQLLLRDRLARRVDGGEVGCLGRLAKVVGVDLEAVPARPATQAHVGPWLQARLEPGLVEPGGPDRAGGVGDGRREDVQPAAAAARSATDTCPR